MNNYTNYLTVLNTIGKPWLTPFWWIYLQGGLCVDINESQEERMNIPLIFFIKNSNLFAEVYSEPCQTSKMENFQKQLQKTSFGCVTGHKEYKGKQKAFLKKNDLPKSDKSVEQRLNLRRSQHSLLCFLQQHIRYLSRLHRIYLRKFYILIIAAQCYFFFSSLHWDSGTTKVALFLFA